MGFDIAELLAEQLKEEQRLHRSGDFEKAEVFKDLENSLKNMHLFLSGELPSYTDEKIRMLSNHYEDARWVEHKDIKREDIKRKVRNAKRRQSTQKRDEHNA